MKKIFMGVIISTFLFACNNEKTGDKQADGTTVSSSDKKADSELLDIAEADIVKNSFAALSKKDINGMTADFADTIRYTWSNGDSLIGKKAVQDYWTNRLGILDSLSFSEQIMLPVNVHKAQSQYTPTGKWILYWSLVNVKYKNGKKLMFWSHSVNHLNTDGKVDFISVYQDRHPIMEATKGL
jgi:hypothetical protein